MSCLVLGKRTFTFVAFIPLTMFSPMNDIQCHQIHVLLGEKLPIFHLIDTILTCTKEFYEKKFKTSCKRIQVATCLYYTLEEVDSQIINNYYHLIVIYFA
jgi:hypothetical protein